MKQRPSGKLLHSTGSSAQRSVMTYRGGMGAGGGREKLKREEIYVYI